jgi:eukaryotic-like serine/threonine-protein kinase
MPLSAGTRLGPYEIIAPLGAGGMGEVYRASDPRLHREVAIKIAAVQFSERFEREARVVAALNHPNICHIYDVGPNYLVMELVEGPTLGERIKQGAMPLDETLDIARQIVAALEAAHERGIVHRDFKPGNVKIRPDGTVKVLDFGLAKMVEDTKTGGSPESSPTVTLEQLTRVGVVLGTAGYMAPEQARGKPVDKRADIWAFGVVLYEMLAGERLFQGETVSDSLAAVLKAEPEWDRVPAKAERLLRRCLEKDPKRRLRDIGDAWPLLEDAPATQPAPRGWPWLGWAVAALLAAAGLPLAFVHFREKPRVAEPVRFQIPLPAGSGQFGLSPDGRWLAFMVQGAQGRALWLRALDSLESRPLPGTADIGRTFFWSPDSRSIAFGAGGKLKKLGIFGGFPQTICDIDLSSGGVGGAWNSDGVIIFGGDPSGIMRVSAAGGVATPLTAPRGNFHAFPSFLPDGRHFVYLSASTDPGIFLGSLDAKPEQQSSKRLLATLHSPVYAPSPDAAWGYLLFLHEGTLMAQGFDTRRLELRGEPVPVAERLGKFLLLGFFSASANDVLAYRSGAPFALARPTWFDRQGKALGTSAEAGTYVNLALSPDGKRVATARIEATGDAVGQDIWLLDFARGGSTRFTFGPGPAMWPVWSPDGARIVFQTLDGLYLKPASGAGKEEPLLKTKAPIFPDDWSRDGRFLLYSAIDPKTGYDLWVLPDLGGASGDRKATPFLQTQFNERYGQFSPDSHWIAYVSDESGRPEVYVRPFPASSNGGAKVKVSQEGGSQPRWRKDGKELFYLSPDGKLMAVEVVATGPVLQTGIPKPLFQVPASSPINDDAFSWDVAADGKRFLINTMAVAPAAEPVTVVLNWTAGLKK